MTEHRKQVGIIGTGVIGGSWAITFARAGYEVRLFDIDPTRASSACVEARAALSNNGKSQPVSIHVAKTLDEAVRGAVYVQESCLEDRDTKERVLLEIDTVAEPDAVIGSSSSALPPSTFLRSIPGRHRCMVAHPFNPPHLIPLVELVPASFTDPAALNYAQQLLRAVGQSPIVVHGEVLGYVGNRLQVAVVNEALSLVARGIVSPSDLDLSLRLGLGERWSLMGPFETMDLNAAGGFAEYAAKFRASYEAVGRDLHVADPWVEEAICAVAEWRRSEVSLAQLKSRIRWRDEALARNRATRLAEGTSGVTL